MRTQIHSCNGVGAAGVYPWGGGKANQPMEEEEMRAEGDIGDKGVMGVMGDRHGRRRGDRARDVYGRVARGGERGTAEGSGLNATARRTSLVSAVMLLLMLIGEMCACTCSTEATFIVLGPRGPIGDLLEFGEEEEEGLSISTANTAPSISSKRAVGCSRVRVRQGRRCTVAGASLACMR
jgi:hypothetical protein